VNKEPNGTCGQKRLRGRYAIAVVGVTALVAVIASLGAQQSVAGCCPCEREASYLADLSLFAYTQERKRLRWGENQPASEWTEFNLQPDPEDWPSLYAALASNPDLPVYFESAAGTLKRCLDAAHPSR